ncbi:MAG: SGNH/GDSL hydrolase family protein [Candidatus Omnitrophica bacterium]|nr:SGNH/GDSL hydrolase family protein [Candidatus Omnitrophota bacterium]
MLPFIKKFITKEKFVFLPISIILFFYGIFLNKLFFHIGVAPLSPIPFFSANSSLLIFQISLLIGSVFLLIIRPSNKNIYAMAIGIFSLLAILELLCRIWLYALASEDTYKNYALIQEIPKNMLRWQPHHYLNYYPSPNYKNGLTSHNSLGYRGEEFSIKKPEGVFRIAILGGSTVYTEQVKDDTKTFPYLLEQILKKKYGYANVQVINAGVPGYNSWESLINLEFRVLDLSPDMVIIYHGVNDAHARFVNPNNYSLDNSGRRKQWEYPKPKWWEQSTFLRTLSRRLGFSKQVNQESLIQSPYAIAAYSNYWSNRYKDHFLEIAKRNYPKYFEHNLRNMIAIDREYGIITILSTWAYSPYFADYMSFDHYKEAIKQNNDVVKAVGKMKNIPVFDFEKIMPKKPDLWSDGRHVNEAGALVKAALFADFLDKTKVIPK